MSRNAVRVLAVGLYGFPALAVFALLAPVLPEAVQPAAYSARAVVPGVHEPAAELPPQPPEIQTRSVRIKRAEPVALLALRAGSTPFELYALNPQTLDGIVVERSSRVRMPR